MEKFRELFAESRARSAVIIGVLVIALAVPITMRLVSQQQDLRQLAAPGGPTCGAGEVAVGGNVNCGGLSTAAEHNQQCKDWGAGNWCYGGKCWECVKEDEPRCLQDTKTCSDGTVVARDPDKNCEFEDCPNTQGSLPGNNDNRECVPDSYRTSPNCRKCDENGFWQKDYDVGDWQTCFCKDNPNDASCSGGGGSSSQGAETVCDWECTDEVGACNTSYHMDGQCIVYEKGTGIELSRYNNDKCDIGNVECGVPDSGGTGGTGGNGGSSGSGGSGGSGGSSGGGTGDSSGGGTGGSSGGGSGSGSGGGTGGQASTSTCFGRVSYFVKDTSGKYINNSGITIDVRGSAGNYTARPISFYNNAPYRLAIEQLPEGNYTVDMNLNGWNLVNLIGTNHAQFFSQNSLRVDCPPDLDPQRQDILIMYADLVVSKETSQTLTCGERCSTDTDCAGSTDGCSACTGTESEKNAGRGVCGSVETSPTPSDGPTCGKRCAEDSECAGSTDGCTICDGGSTRRVGNNTYRIYGTCKTSTSPTDAPSCGASCNTNTDCAGATGSCTVCQNVGGAKQCTTAPTATPTPTVTTTPPVSCGSTCTTDSTCAAAADGCNKCVTTSSGGKTCQRNGITPTPTVGANDTAVRLRLQMPGIGQNTGDNQSPNNPNRTADVQVYNSDNQLVKEASGTTTFNDTDTYIGLINLGQLPGGVYYLHAGFDNTLVSRVPGVVQLAQSQTTDAAVTTLIPGDLNRNNILDVIDYNIFLECYGSKQCAQKSLSDFNDDGQVAGQDYNILLRSFAIRQGD